MYYYHGFHLNIKSEIALPELQESFKAHDNPDVVIAFGDVSAQGLSAAAMKGAFYACEKNTLWLNVPSVARYLVSDGKHIVIHPLLTADAMGDEDSIRVFLLGSCMGALLMQRDLFLLHANAIKVDDICVSFSGCSGAGKSTLSAAFMRRGYAVLADDVCVINARQEVVPGFPQIKLWADASQKLAIQTRSLKRIRPQLEKFAVPLNAQFYNMKLPLKFIYILSPHHENVFKFERLQGLEKILPLKHNTYRHQYLNGLGKTETHLRQVGALASVVSVTRILRPKAGFQLDKLVDLIEADLAVRVSVDA